MQDYALQISWNRLFTTDCRGDCDFFWGNNDNVFFFNKKIPDT